LYILLLADHHVFDATKPMDSPPVGVLPGDWNAYEVVEIKNPYGYDDPWLVLKEGNKNKPNIGKARRAWERSPSAIVSDVLMPEARLRPARLLPATL
jgi:hypothetical protein